ncbi:MAG TPA: DUF6457 domain-containing protein [Micromonosporaceae bacterium]
MSTLDEWLSAACAELALDPNDVDVPLVLNLARDVAHGVLRPGAPLTAYLLGVAVGRGAEPRPAAAALSELAARWAQSRPADA